MRGRCRRTGITSGWKRKTDKERMKKEEKKVEYLELIYDLIFVYIVGRNNSLLHNVEGGFIRSEVFVAYIVCSLAIIQIWTFSTFYTNMYGRNGLRDHIFMFVNMYLLYYIGEGTRLHWERFQNQYHAAWALILINIGLQYLIEYRQHRASPGERRNAKGMMAVLFGEAVIVLIAIPVYNVTGVQIAAAAILYGMVAAIVFTRENRTDLVDFAHLSERAMLYVVFTFGEMIIAIASYFEGGFDFSSVYFSTMCFLIVTALFLGYEVLYNHIIDRELQVTGMGYMLIHVFLIFGMNSITASLEFMRDEEVALWPKILFLTGSFLWYFLCLYLLLRYAKDEMRHCGRFVIQLVVTSAVFALLMILLRENMRLNILVSVLYAYSQFWMIFQFSRRRETQQVGKENIAL